MRLNEPAPTKDRFAVVLDSIDATALTFTDTVISASAALNSLLDLWSAVHEVDRASAGPIEQLLVGLNRRSYTTPRELRDALEMTHILLDASRRSA